MKSSRLFAVSAILWAPLVAATSVRAQTTSVNYGLLGAAGNGTHTANGASEVVLNVPGPLAAAGDVAVSYAGGARTLVPYNLALNPVVSDPFSIEFWAMPTVSDNDDSPVANRIASGNRSGWVFFQRAAATGWNFRMYNGVGSGLGWDLTGGTANLNAWSHVVATWNGSAAQLYVNGTLADATNDPGATGVYNVTTSAIFSIGALQDAFSASTASIDEVAYYRSALTPAQIAGHYAASLTTPGAYRNVILADSPIVYLPNWEPSTPTFAPGDINKDGSVTRADAALFAGFFGTAAGSVWETGDFNADGATNVADLALLQANLSPLASDSPAAVPEPSSAILAIAGFAWLTRFRRSERRRVTA
jgi:hypothetical protein